MSAIMHLWSGVPLLLLVTAGCPSSSAGESDLTGPPDASGPPDLAVSGPPILSAVTPLWGPTAGGIMLQVDGQNFVAGGKVTIGGLPSAQVTLVSSARLSVSLPPRLGMPGKVPVVVANPNGQQTSRQDLFGYYLSQLSFQGPAFNAGTAPSGLALEDFNSDGRPDIVAANNQGSSVSVLLGDANGGFGAPRTVNFAAADGVITVIAGDFNGDTKPDLAVVHPSSNPTGHVSVVLGDGAGNFGAAKRTPVGTIPLSAATGDFNGDARLDLAVANSSSNNVSVLLGDGTGGFAPQTVLPAGVGTSAVVIADLAGDGKFDLAATNTTGDTVSVFDGDGVGGFAAARNIQVGSRPSSLRALDLSGDSRLDLIVANTGAGTLSVVLADDRGGFVAAKSYPAGVSPRSVALGDLNGDGRPDAIVANFSGNTLSILTGDGAGGLAAPAPFATGAGPYALLASNLDDDGKLDLAVANITGNTVSLLVNRSQ